MNKHDIVRKIATKHDKSVIEIRRIIDDFLDEIMLTVVQKGRFVQLVGFGKFYTLVRKARRGRNPRTGETMHLKESTRITFLPGSLFKRMLRSKKQVPIEPQQTSMF